MLALLGVMQAWAYDCKVNGICYNLNISNQTARVTYSGWPNNNEYMGTYHSSDKLTGDLVIPASITYNDVEYTVTAINANAFYDVNYDLYFTSVTIPSSLTEIQSKAFSKCNNLTSVVCVSETPFDLVSDAFSRISSECVLSVPYGTRDAYIAAGWTTDIFKGGIIEMAPNAINVSISDVGIATYCSSFDLDFDGVSGLKAYIVSGFSPSTGKLTLTPVMEVPAGEGLLLKGAEGNYEIPCASTDMYYSNLLTGVTTATEISPTDGDQTNFILANGSHGINFYTLSGTGNLAAGRAYLHLPTSAVASIPNEVKGFTLVFEGEEDEATGIMNTVIKAERYDCYDMQGRRVAQPTRGVYIMNGKKVFIK